MCFGSFFCLFCFFLFSVVFCVFYLRSISGCFGLFWGGFSFVRRFGGRRPSYGAQIPLFWSLFFFGVSVFLLFLFCFGVCCAFFGRVRVQILFLPLRFKTALKTQCFGYFFCLFCFFAFCGFLWVFLQSISGCFGLFWGCFWHPADSAPL